jgi:uncharacterized small protein (DUF1192 family)
MIYINSNPNPSGAYSNPQTQPFPSCVALTDEQAATFFQYNGFVEVTVDNGGAVTVEPNMEVWEAWKKEQEDAELAGDGEEEVVEDLLETRVTALEERVAALEAEIAALKGDSAE